MKTKLIALAVLAASNFAYADSYDITSNRLTIPSITLSTGATYTNVVVTISQILSFNTGTPPAADSYDSATNTLTIPSITVLGTTYRNVKVTIGAVLAATYAGGANSGGSASGDAFCSAASAPAGFNISQSGNTINITTNGCVAPPTGSMCTPTAATATGVNVLETTSTQNMKWGGITFTNSSFSSMLNSFGSSASTKVCIRNAPNGLYNQTINSNVCLDMTNQLGSSFSQLAASGMATVTPPITMSYTGTVSMQTVSDCTTSGASMIIDAYTNQVLMKQADGSYK